MAQNNCPEFFGGVLNPLASGGTAAGFQMVFDIATNQRDGQLHDVEVEMDWKDGTPHQIFTSKTADEYRFDAIHTYTSAGDFAPAWRSRVAGCAWTEYGGGFRIIIRWKCVDNTPKLLNVTQGSGGDANGRQYMTEAECRANGCSATPPTNSYTRYRCNSSSGYCESFQTTNQSEGFDSCSAANCSSVKFICKQDSYGVPRCTSAIPADYPGPFYNSSQECENACGGGGGSDVYWCQDGNIIVAGKNPPQGVTSYETYTQCYDAGCKGSDCYYNSRLPIVEHKLNSTDGDHLQIKVPAQNNGFDGEPINGNLGWSVTLHHTIDGVSQPDIPVRSSLFPAYIFITPATGGFHEFEAAFEKPGCQPHIEQAEISVVSSSSCTPAPAVVEWAPPLRNDGAIVAVHWRIPYVAGAAPWAYDGPVESNPEVISGGWTYDRGASSYHVAGVNRLSFSSGFGGSDGALYIQLEGCSLGLHEISLVFTKEGCPPVTLTGSHTVLPADCSGGTTPGGGGPCQAGYVLNDCGKCVPCHDYQHGCFGPPVKPGTPTVAKAPK